MHIPTAPSTLHLALSVAHPWLSYLNMHPQDPNTPGLTGLLHMGKGKPFTHIQVTVSPFNSKRVLQALWGPFVASAFINDSLSFSSSFSSPK